MTRILVTGAAGQVGSELTMALRGMCGNDNVVASDKKTTASRDLMDSGPYEIVDCTDGSGVACAVKKHKIDTIYHLAALLSAVAEAEPNLAWHVNVNGLYNVLEVSRENRCAVFTPSSIACFGPTTPRDGTPQDTIQRPTSMYGVTKVAGELLCDYYFSKFDVDVRGVRYPGIISNVTLPGGGTTDYAVEIYYEAIKKKRYTCYLKPDTTIEMIYMPDAIKATIDLMGADPSRLKHRNAFNITAMSFDPETLAAEITKVIPEFTIDYRIDPIRQSIAESWPSSIDDSAAREEWGWLPSYDLTAMTKDMIEKLRIKLTV